MLNKQDTHIRLVLCQCFWAHIRILLSNTSCSSVPAFGSSLPFMFTPTLTFNPSKSHCCVALWHSPLPSSIQMISLCFMARTGCLLCVHISASHLRVLQKAQRGGSWTERPKGLSIDLCLLCSCWLYKPQDPLLRHRRVRHLFSLCATINGCDELYAWKSRCSEMVKANALPFANSVTLL